MPSRSSGGRRGRSALTGRFVRQSRPGGAWETSRKRGLFRRLTLRRADGVVYLDRWGLATDRAGGILLHKMDGPDPGTDLHDHPWWFVSIILWGGYTEQRALIRDAPMLARIAEKYPPTCARGVVERRRWLSVRTMRLDECHTITHLNRRHSLSLVIKGPRRRSWGFYLPDGYMPEKQYDATVRAARRDLWSDQNAANRPWQEIEPGACGDPACHVLHRDPQHPIHPPEPGERPHRHLVARHVHPNWHGHCDPDEPGYKPCDQAHWHFWWRHRHA